MGRVLIMTVGTGIKGKEEESRDSQGHGIACAIKEVEPEKIIFLITEESEKTLEYVDRYLKDGLKKLFYNSERIKLSDMEDINKLIKEISGIFEKNKHKELIVVPTFGTKAMSISLSIAGVLYNSEIRSVNGDREQGIIVKGTEKLEQQKLWYLKNRFCIEKVKEFFKLYKFDSALNRLEEIVRVGEFNTIYSEYKNIIEGYILWDRLKYEEAFLKFKDVENKNKLGKNFEFIRELYSIKKELENKKECFKKLTGEEREKIENEIKKLEKDEKIYILFDLYSNARRRFEEKKYDDCMARIYRIIEFIAQIVLWSKYNISVSDQMFGEISECYDVYITYREKIEKNIESFEEFKKFCDGDKLRIGLEKCYNLLSDLGDELGNFIKNEKIKKILSQRNNSILAHGIQPIKEESCREAIKEVENLLKKLCAKESYNFNELIEKTSFIKEL